MTQVLVRLVSDDPSPVRIAGVVVEFYNTSAVFQTSGTTDTNGEVQVTLPDAQYDLMFFKTGVTILPKQPQRITVDTLLTNHFQVTGHIRTAPESVDPKLCTVSGTILGVAGNAEVFHLIFEPLRLLSVIDGYVISPYGRIEIRADENGYFEFELLRNFKYNMYFLYPQDLFKQQPGRLCVQTPDAPAVGLTNLLFPLPLTATMSQTTLAIAVNNGVNDTTTLSLTFTDGSTRPSFATPWAGIDVTNSNPTVVATSLKDGVVSISPLSAGTSTITTVRVIPENTVLFNPLPAYISDSIVVTVS